MVGDLKLEDDGYGGREIIEEELACATHETMMERDAAGSQRLGVGDCNCKIG